MSNNHKINPDKYIFTVEKISEDLSKIADRKDKFNFLHDILSILNNMDFEINSNQKLSESEPLGGYKYDDIADTYMSFNRYTKRNLIKQKNSNHIKALSEWINNEIKGINLSALDSIKENNKIVQNKNRNIEKILLLGIKKEQLQILSNKLYQHKYIDEDSVDIFPYHFCFTNNDKEFPENLKSINWIGKKYLLLALFQELDNQEVLDQDFYQNKYIQISNHFLSREKVLNNKNLAKNQKNVTKDNTKNIRTIVNEVIGN